MSRRQLNYIKLDLGVTSLPGEDHFVIPEKNFNSLVHFVSNILELPYSVSRREEEITEKHIHNRQAEHYCTLCPSNRLVSALHAGSFFEGFSFYGIPNDIILVQPSISINDIEKYTRPLVNGLKTESASLLEEEKVGILANKAKKAEEAILYLQSVANPDTKFEWKWYNNTNFSMYSPYLDGDIRFMMCSEHIGDLEDQITPAIKELATKKLKPYEFEIDPEDIVVTYETEKIFDSNPTE